MKAKVCDKHFVYKCLWKQFFAFKSHQIPLNFFSTILVTKKALTQFQSRIRATKLQLSANFSIFSLRSKYGIERLVQDGFLER